MVMVVASGCGDEASSTEPTSDEPTTTVRLGPLTPRDPDRISPDQHAAIAALAAAVSPESPESPGEHEGHDGHAAGGPASTVPLSPGDQAAFDAEWSAAVAAESSLDTPAEATAAGYTRAAVQGSGVGVHWVNWELIDAPFDPTRPSMLLFDERDGRERLVGFSYWLRSEAPEGFAGPNDVWHQHTNLCIVNGWVDRERAATPVDCAGHFLAGSDLWMLHAWVVPAYDNPWGAFATLHPGLCPGPGEAVADIARCPGT